MKQLRILASLLMILAMASCAKDNRWDCFTGMGDMRTETRVLPPFASIVAFDRINFEYHYSPTYRIEVTFGENILDHIGTTVDNGVLMLTNDARCNWVRDLSTHPSVVLYAPSIERFENRGNGHISFVDTLITPSFFYEEFEANGRADLLLRTNEAKIWQHTGRTIITVRGITMEAGLFIGGAGTLDASGLFAETAVVNNSSFQDMTVFAAHNLFAHITERGNVCYFGNPGQIDTVVEGSGTLLQCVP